MTKLKSLVTEKTSVFIYNNYQNPMGACSSDEEMADIAKLCVEHKLWVLSDEAYFDIVFGPFPASIAFFVRLNPLKWWLTSFSF